MNRVESRARGASRLPRTLGISFFLLVGWSVPLPQDLRFLPWFVLVAGFIALARTAFEIRLNTATGSRVVILGSGALALMLADELESCERARYVVAGVVDDEPTPESWSRTRWLGPLDRLAEIVEDVRADRIVVALQDRRGHLPLTQLLASRVRGIAVEDALECYERLTGAMAIETLTPGALILSKGFRNHGAHATIARAISVAAAIIGLVLVAPLLALIAIAIKLDSKGSVLFMQDRAGSEGRPFKLLKFRTMRPCDEPPSEWARDNTSRITRVGRWLRRFRLDELPQLVNILRGEMNLIGPRPHPMCNQRIFMERIAYYGLRSTVRPGVTGWAQVRYGYANNIEEETRKMRYDLYYIKNRSLLLDARILLETVGIMLLGQGANEVRLRSRVPVQEQPVAVPVVETRVVRG